MIANGTKLHPRSQVELLVDVLLMMAMLSYIVLRSDWSNSKTEGSSQDPKLAVLKMSLETI